MRNPCPPPPGRGVGGEESLPPSPGRGVGGEGPVSSLWRLSVSAWCVVAAFGTYFCMYAFRQPFKAGDYAETFLGKVDYKTIFVTAQVLGYTLSKFLGIKIVAEVQRQQRVVVLFALIALAEVALLLFALTPAPFNCLWLFLNGIPLGMVFGLVLGFLEGRRQTEALMAGLCASFIVADGVTMSVGAYLLEWGVSKYWMPFTAGLLFVPPLVFFGWMLTLFPARPSRTLPPEVNGFHDRRRTLGFLGHAVGLILVLLIYLLITDRAVSGLISDRRSGTDCKQKYHPMCSPCPKRLWCGRAVSHRHRGADPG